MKPNEKELMEKRGRIVTNFSYQEELVKKYICLHYFKTVYNPIISEIFEDEYFNFGLLLKIFEKIILKEKIKFPIDKLRRLSQLRNIVAHAQIHSQITGFSEEEITRTYFRHGGEDKEIEKTFKEYDEIKTKVSEALKTILRPGVDMRVLPKYKGEKPL